MVASKPGTLAGGEQDRAAVLLAEVVAPAPSSTILDLNCGTGLTGAMLATLVPAGRVIMADANVIEVEAAQRTVAATGLTNAAVHLSHGTNHLALAAPVDLVTIRLPKGKGPTLQLLWDAFVALPPGGRCHIAGANDEGIQSALRHAAELFGSASTVAYQKGYRVGVAIKAEPPPPQPAVFTTPYLDHGAWHRFTVDIRGERYTVCSRPGVFSWERLDDGTRALLETMAIGPGETVLDLGCGAGITGVVAARLSQTGMVTMVDVALEALEAARRTVATNGLTNCMVLPSDGAAAVRDRRFDVVITNPPFHVGKATTYDAAVQFVQDAAAVLRPGGRLWLVANRFIPYEGIIQSQFGSATIAQESGRYKVLVAEKATEKTEKKAGASRVRRSPRET